ncbi:MAG: hypothetical protein QOH35_5317, partial [Acidobacteriaceae bacterium]|nr:hypothetical protein [Acidobacteriaceae bacterium]
AKLPLVLRHAMPERPLKTDYQWGTRLHKIVMSPLGYGVKIPALDSGPDAAERGCA